MKTWEELSSRQRRAIKDALERGEVEVSCPWWPKDHWETKSTGEFIHECWYRINPLGAAITLIERLVPFLEQIAMPDPSADRIRAEAMLFLQKQKVKQSLKTPDGDVG